MMCDCCDHPLEHAISKALDAYENGTPIVSVKSILSTLRDDLDAWREDVVEKRMAGLV